MVGGRCYSWETKGLAMASIPSTGHINTTAVPLNMKRKQASSQATHDTKSTGCIFRSNQTELVNVYCIGCK